MYRTPALKVLKKEQNLVSFFKEKEKWVVLKKSRWVFFLFFFKLVFLNPALR